MESSVCSGVGRMVHMYCFRNFVPYGDVVIICVCVVGDSHCTCVVLG